MAITKPALTMSFCLINPDPYAIAFGGVETGNIIEQEEINATITTRAPTKFPTAIPIGTIIVVAAVWLINEDNVKDNNPKIPINIHCCILSI